MSTLRNSSVRKICKQSWTIKEACGSGGAYLNPRVRFIKRTTKMKRTRMEINLVKKTKMRRAVMMKTVLRKESQEKYIGSKSSILISKSKT